MRALVRSSVKRSTKSFRTAAAAAITAAIRVASCVVMTPNEAVEKLTPILLACRAAIKESAMARYKPVDISPRFLPVDL